MKISYEGFEQITEVPKKVRELEGQLNVKLFPKWANSSVLKKLQRVEQVDFHIGDNIDVRFVNLQQKTNKVFDDIGMSHLFERKTCTT